MSLVDISSDTNVWLDFATIDRLELPFKLPFTYLMNEEAAADELLNPPGLGEDLVRHGLQKIELTGDGPLRKAAAAEGVEVMGTIGILDRLYDGNYIDEEEFHHCIGELVEHNGGKIRLPVAELKKRMK